jgi:TonB family protein
VPAPAEPPKTTVKNTPKPPARETVPDKPSLEPAPKKHEIDVDLTQDTRSSKKPSKSADNAAESRAAAQSAARAASKKLAQEVANAFAGLDSNLHSTEPASKVVALSTGTGGEGGGEAFVNYRTAVFNAYYQAWKTPDGTTHNLAVTDAKIVIQRDGTVSFSEIVNKSGDTAVDRSVQRALDAVRRLPPFPPGALDAERSFIIRFNLEAKQEAG